MSAPLQVFGGVEGNGTGGPRCLGLARVVFIVKLVAGANWHATVGGAVGAGACDCSPRAHGCGAAVGVRERIEPRDSMGDEFEFNSFGQC